jgi:hypothetical protein
MRTAWGVFRAARMTGLDDRDDSYRFWYAAVDLQPGEHPVASWKVIRDPRSVMGAGAGNLILSDLRLIYEPMRNQRAAWGPHGVKPAVNLLSRYFDSRGTALPFALPLTDIARVAATGTERMGTLTVVDRAGATAEFLTSRIRPPVGSRHREVRDEALTRISGAVGAGPRRP